MIPGGVARIGLVAALALVVLAAPGPVHADAPAATHPHAGSVTPQAPCPVPVHARELAPGLRIEHVLIPGSQNRVCLWMVRVDPRRFALRLLASGSMDAARTPAEWIADAGLVAVINAAMYTPSGRPTGLTIADGKVVYGRVTPSYKGFLAWGPTRRGLPDAVLTGRGCPGFDLEALRRDYRNLVQNNRLLGCGGEPLRWQDPRWFSAAAVGLDGDGSVVFLHATETMPMTELARALADPRLGLSGALYVEGGSPAQLSVHLGETRIERRGRSELGIFGGGGEAEKLPVVLGFSPR